MHVALVISPRDIYNCRDIIVAIYMFWPCRHSHSSTVRGVPFNYWVIVIHNTNRSDVYSNTSTMHVCV